MPIENEIKFVLKFSPDFEKIAKYNSGNYYYINQAYLLSNRGLTVRIRRQEDIKHKVKYWLTTKQKVEDNVIEIEKKISEFDYNELSKVSSCWVKKVRYKIKDWEIDFFKDNNDETYFVVAEIEMKPDETKPKYHIGFVSDNLLYEVPKDDCRFSSKKLSDVIYAKDLLNELI